MLKPRQLYPLLLPLVLGATGPLAQPAPPPTADPAPAAAPGAPAGTTGPEQAPPSSGQGGTPAKAGADSPFDYRPSEEISEDLPVSFPVDI